MIKSLRMQPTFTVNVSSVPPIDPKGAIAKLRKAIGHPELEANTKSAGRCVDFRIDPVDQRFWSPHLSIQVEPQGEGSVIIGRFSPRPEIWTMFMAIYGVVMIGIFAAAIYGYVQWSMENVPWVLALIPAGLIVIGALHVASLIGQSLSRDQMELLRSRFDLAVELAFNQSAATEM